MAHHSDNEALKILIVGAGIGGLTAALGLRQQGHHVTLFERSQLAQETGAAIHLAPNCHGLLRRFGVFPESFGANPVKGVSEREQSIGSPLSANYYKITEYTPDGTLKFDINVAKPNAMWQHPWVLSHRVGLHEELKNQATVASGPGMPATLHTSSPVVDVNVSTATVVLESGATFSGDLVIGADGVSSVTRKAVVGDDIKPFGSGKSAFRFMIPRQKMLDDPATQSIATREGYMTMWIGNDCRLIMYPCSDNTLMNFVAIHPSHLSASKGEGWSRGGSKETLLEIYKDFEPLVQCILGMVEASSLKVWTLLDMERIPSWTKGRLALLGDAAHPFLPHQGQGGGVAIEDATSLCALLPKGTDMNDIPERLAMYQTIRDERAHKIQEFTRLVGTDLDDKSRGEFNIMEYTNYNFGHDEWHNSSHVLKKHLWSRNGPVHWRSPMSWGPLPSPRQDHYGRPIPAQKSRFITHSVRFKTSATFLKTLFPNDGFSFINPGTVAEASFKCTELDEMKWLGGGGYKFFGLWIHGVQYTKEDGTKVQGTFLPVLLETLADPILTGREELGMPKLYCDIGVAKDEGSTRITCNWRGAKFVDIKMTGLESVPASGEPNGVNGSSTKPATSPDPAGDNILIYRYVPAVGKPGVADAEYPVAISEKLSRVSQVIERTRMGTGSAIKCTGGDWETLPTLHHVASGFAEIPIYDVVETKSVEGHGVDDLAQASRIE